MPKSRNCQRQVCPTPAAGGLISHTFSRCGTILGALVRSARKSKTACGSALMILRFSMRDMRNLLERLERELAAEAGDVINPSEVRCNLGVNGAIDIFIAFQQRP